MQPLKRSISIAVIFFILGISISFFILKNNQTQSPPLVESKQESSKPLGFISKIKTTKGLVYLLIDQDHISFNPFETAVNNGTYVTIEKEKYPKLFKQGIGNYSVFRADKYIDPQTKEFLIKLSNNQPDHGGFASTYVLLVNPFTGEIKEGKTDYQLEKE